MRGGEPGKRVDVRMEREGWANHRAGAAWPRGDLARARHVINAQRMTTTRCPEDPEGVDRR